MRISAFNLYERVVWSFSSLASSLFSLGDKDFVKQNYRKSNIKVFSFHLATETKQNNTLWAFYEKLKALKNSLLRILLYEEL